MPTDKQSASLAQVVVAITSEAAMFVYFHIRQRVEPGLLSFSSDKGTDAQLFGLDTASLYLFVDGVIGKAISGSDSARGTVNL